MLFVIERFKFFAASNHPFFSKDGDISQLAQDDNMTPPVAIIGGTGLTVLDTLKMIRQETVSTPYGRPSSPLMHGELDGHPVVFLARHGLQHTLPPHRINYRANLWALHHVGVQQVIAVAAVGGIRADMAPGV
ncbi:MAG: 5-methylthioinosine phosphorylase, partial [Pseudomonadota bacterium]|nr:5-methylthioinosine phosphorylase [Pseudomonadota bacterium]